MCSSRNYPCPPQGRFTEVPRGREVSKAQFFEKKYDTKMEFPAGGGFNLKNVPWAGYGHFLEQHNAMYVRAEQRFRRTHLFNPWTKLLSVTLDPEVFHDFNSSLDFGITSWIRVAVELSVAVWYVRSHSSDNFNTYHSCTVCFDVFLSWNLSENG